MGKYEEQLNMHFWEKSYLARCSQAERFLLVDVMLFLYFIGHNHVLN